MKVTLLLSVKTALNKGPNIRVRINKQLVHSHNILSNVQLDFEFESQSVNQLTIEHFDKDPSDIPAGEDIACIIDAIKFNGIELHRNMLYTGEFYPNWQYGDVDNIVHNNWYLGYNGVWSICFPEDPIAWMMDYLDNQMFTKNNIILPAQSDTDDDFDDFKHEILG